MDLTSNRSDISRTQSSSRAAKLAVIFILLALNESPSPLRGAPLPVISRSWISISVSQDLLSCIATNHSDFGGILPLFTQYSAIPIGMTKFRQNKKIL